jgi:hypothetical protein
MTLKWIATAALASALIPCAAMAQAKTGTDTSKAAQAPRRDSAVTSTATGDVSSSNAKSTAGITPDMLKAQQDPNIIGSPAWWKTHATADGQPISAARKPD